MGAVPAITNVPPQEPVYQFQLAPVPKLPPVIPSVDEEPLQTGDVPVAEVADVDKVFTFNITLLQLENVDPNSCLTK